MHGSPGFVGMVSVLQKETKGRAGRSQGNSSAVYERKIEITVSSRTRLMNARVWNRRLSVPEQVLAPETAVRWQNSRVLMS